MVSTTNAANNYATPSAAVVATPSAAVYARVQRVMASQNTGVVKLNAALAHDQTRLSALGQLSGALSGLQAIAQALGGAGLSTSATASSPGVLAAVASGAAASGSHAVDVQQLAQGQSLSSAVQAGAGTAIGSGAKTVIKVEFGTTAGNGFTPNGAAGSKTLTIDSSNNTLQGIAAALKSAGIDASVVASGKGVALSINGPSGSANSMRVSVGGDAALKDLLAYNPSGIKKLNQGVPAQDALLTLDGKDIKSASNTLTGALAGTTLSLTATGKTNVLVAQDSSKIAGNIGTLVGAYNSLNAKLKSLQQGDLKSDLALGQVSSQLSQLLQAGGTSVAALAGAGISIARNGDLQIDASKLDSAVAADPGAVGKLFTNNGKGIADQLVARIALLTGDSGAISRETGTAGADLAALNGKKADLGKALTAQATALAKLYSQQEQASANGAGTSLFDFMA